MPLETKAVSLGGVIFITSGVTGDPTAEDVGFIVALGCVFVFDL